jgi:hypothetical protein
MAKLSDHSIITATKHQVSCDLSGEAAILNLSDGVYYGLNAVGSTIWNLLQKPVSVSEIRTTILNEYDVDAARCDEDMQKLLSELIAHGLAEVSGANAS